MKVTRSVLYVIILVMVLLGIKWTSALYALCVWHCTQVRFSELEKIEQPSPTVPVSRQEILLRAAKRMRESTVQYRWQTLFSQEKKKKRPNKLLLTNIMAKLHVHELTIHLLYCRKMQCTPCLQCRD